MKELSLHLLDIAQNSIAAGAHHVDLGVEERGEMLWLTVADDGRGMSPEFLANVTDPFTTTRTTRKVGLGVPLFKMEAEMTGGDFSIQSQLGKGTTVRARFVTSHVDMIPLGNINDTILLLVSCNPERDFRFVHQVDGRELELDTRQLREVLGEDVPLNDPDVVQWIRGYLQEQSDLLQGGEST